jgi:hypothetical protein
MKTLILFITLFGLFQEKPKEKVIYNNQKCLGCPDGFIKVYEIYHFDEIERAGDGILINYYIFEKKTQSKSKPIKKLVGIENIFTGMIFWHRNYLIK